MGGAGDDGMLESLRSSSASGQVGTGFSSNQEGSAAR